MMVFNRNRVLPSIVRCRRLQDLPVLQDNMKSQYWTPLFNTIGIGKSCLPYEILTDFLLLQVYRVVLGWNENIPWKNGAGK